MGTKNEWMRDEAAKKKLIAVLTPELSLLRSKAEISQSNLASAIGISRQTYNSIEIGARKMSWNVYMALMFFYDCNKKTHQFIRTLGVFPQELVAWINNEDVKRIAVESFLDEDAKDIVEQLDGWALQSIRAVIMVEYGRCAGLSCDAIMKSFENLSLSRSLSEGGESQDGPAQDEAPQEEP